MCFPFGSLLNVSWSRWDLSGWRELKRFPGLGTVLSLKLFLSGCCNYKWTFSQSLKGTRRRFRELSLCSSLLGYPSPQTPATVPFWICALYLPNSVTWPDWVFLPSSTAVWKAGPTGGLGDGRAHFHVCSFPLGSQSCHACCPAFLSSFLYSV